MIGARGITITADAKTQTYGNAVPTLTYNVGGLGLVNGDTLSGGLATTASATANVGTYGISLGTLAASSNYAISYTGANDVIGARGITITADAKTQTYGNAVPTLTYNVGGLGLVNGDTLSGGLATTASPTASVGAYGITQGSLAASSNYTVSYVSANDVISARPLTVTADAKTQTYGNAVPTLTYAIGGQGLVNGDTLSGGLATTASTTAGVGTYAITQGTLTNSNYAVTYTGAALTIEPAKTANLEGVPGYADTLLFGFSKQLDALWNQLDWRVSQTLWTDLDSGVVCMLLGCEPKVSHGVSKATPISIPDSNFAQVGSGD